MNCPNYRYVMMLGMKVSINISTSRTSGGIISINTTIISIVATYAIHFKNRLVFIRHIKKAPNRGCQRDYEIGG